MANVLVEESFLQDIADAIRGKNGGSDTYTPAQMGPAVANLSGGAPVLGTKTITYNGTFPASADSLDGYSSVNYEKDILLSDGWGVLSVDDTGDTTEFGKCTRWNPDIPTGWEQGQPVGTDLTPPSFLPTHRRRRATSYGGRKLHRSAIRHPNTPPHGRQARTDMWRSQKPAERFPA